MIRVMIPKMPEPEALLPYLRRMHGARVYVNNGPLVLELQERIEAAIGVPCRMVANGTVAIQLALQALDLRPGSRVLCQAATFSGTGLAIRNAGHVPVLADVEMPTWQLSPHDIPPDVAAVVPVATFGMPVNVNPWVAWAEAMNKLVVIDAAGALLDQPTCTSPRVLMAYSLHATKFIGAGEGGCVAGASSMLLNRVEDLARFGHCGTNAKMSEYHAAVAHASLDTADHRAEMLRTLRMRYISLLLRQLSPGLMLQQPPTQLIWRGGGPGLLPVVLPRSHMAMPVMMALDARGVETRQWYRPFLSERSDMPAMMRGALPVTDILVEHMVGLPLHQHMTIDDVDTVCAHLEAVCAS